MFENLPDLRGLDQSNLPGARNLTKKNCWGGLTSFWKFAGGEHLELADTLTSDVEVICTALCMWNYFDYTYSSILSSFLY